MSLPLVVPYASVLLKWVLPSEEQPDADQALRLRAALLEEKYTRACRDFGSTRSATRSPVVFLPTRKLGFTP